MEFRKRHVLICLIFLLFQQISLGKMLRVCQSGKCSYTSIVKAVQEANPFDSVWVGGGFYHEGNITISKPLTVFSDENAVIDGDHKFEIFSIKSNQVTITGFCLQNTGHSSIEEIAAAHVYNSSGVTITDNRVEDAFFGILLENSTNCRIRSNDLRGTPVDENITGNGIHMWKCDSIMVQSNMVKGHRDGIYLEFVTNSIVYANMSTRNIRYGLHFMFSHSDDYMYNQFTENGAGVAVMFSKHVNMLHNTFSNNWGNAAFGLLLKEIAGGMINYNTFESNTTAAYFEGSSSLSLRGNIFRKNGWALKIQASCSDVKVDSNNFVQNTFDVATNGDLVLNQFNNNYWDKYEGYDLKRDGTGDIPYQPVSLYSMITERNPGALLLLRSFLTTMLDRAEKVLPSITPEKLKDESPLMKPLPL